MNHLWDEVGDTREAVTAMTDAVDIPSRLTALEQRVGALESRAEGCITQDEFRSRLAALRSSDPFHSQVERDAVVDGLRALLAAASRNENRLTREVLTARRERDEARAEVEALRAQVEEERSKRIAAEYELADQVDAQLRVERERDALRAHAETLDTLCWRAAAAMDRHCLVSPVLDALRARGEVPR